MSNVVTGPFPARPLVDGPLPRQQRPTLAGLKVDGREREGRYHPSPAEIAAGARRENLVRVDLAAPPARADLSIPALLARAAARRAADAPRRMVVTDEMLARARRRPASRNPFTLPEFPGAVAPPRRDDRMAMDDSFEWANMAWATMASSAVVEGTVFPGYAFLAELAQRPEYRRFAEIISTEMTRKWIRVQSVGDEDKTERIKELEDALKQLRVKDVFRECIELDEFFGRSHLYIDTGDADNREEERTSIGSGRDETSRAKINRGKIKALRPIEPVWCYPTNYDANDPRRSDWYEPKTWFVMGWEVHRTRLLKFVGRKVPDLLKPAYSFGGLSMSQMAKPYVDNWLRTRQSVADLIHAFSVFVLKTNMAATTQEGGDLLFKRLELFNLLRDNRGLMMVSKDDEDLANVSAPLGGLEALQAQTQEHMAAVAGIPIVKLLGIQPAGLNASSEGEIRSFYDWVHASQEKRVRPNLTTVFDLVQLSLWGEVDEDLVFTFEPLFALDEKGKAEVQEIESRTDASRIDSGVLSPLEVRKRVAADPDSPYASIDVEDVPELKEEEEQGLVPEGGGRATVEAEQEQAGGKPGVGPQEQEEGTDEEELSPFQQRVAARGEQHGRREGDFYERADARRGEGRLNPDYLRERLAKDAEFKQGEHPRDETGKFSLSSRESKADHATEGVWAAELDHLVVGALENLPALRKVVGGKDLDKIRRAGRFVAQNIFVAERKREGTSAQDPYLLHLRAAGEAGRRIERAVTLPEAKSAAEDLEQQVRNLARMRNLGEEEE